MTICHPCTQGDHCHRADCFCQHMPPGTWKGAHADISRYEPSEPVAAPVATSGDGVAAAYPEDSTAVSEEHLADLLARWNENREASGS